ncbi:MAG TPA: alpha/beta fold hydrolase [Luteibacter sp.]|uniref:alpha/beta fold hydrolase n=1 Tax=Luteibacter sp. TaxID=1886636 RepID=UPI002B7924FA|nr:alpha/beta fold hydrolase [Luteibacter sp.]HVI56725.1 alpha/beta fold hydrolase [Luteibacter sp.]
MRPQHAFFCAMLGAATLPTPVAASTSHADDIGWRACDPEETGWNAPALKARLQCGTMRVPLDHSHPAEGEVDVGLIRVLAGDPLRRMGSVFFNFGGPGGNPRRFLPVMADWWNTLEASDPVAGSLRTLADRYDLVAVVPRGLAGGRVYDCLAGRTAGPFNDLSVDASDANWAAATHDAVALAGDCGMDPFSPWVNTAQHVHDMEFARRLFGDAPLNFYGTSYGTWVGAWYAATYPDHVGRMLFDSTMDVTRYFHDAVYTQVMDVHELFLADAVGPALAAPETYGLGSDEAVLLQRVRTMPARAHERWLRTIGGPADLAAAVTLADWLGVDSRVDQATLGRRIASHAFSPDPDTNARIREAAGHLLSAYFSELPSAVDALLGTDGRSVHLAVVCNDTPWIREAAYWRAFARHMAAAYPGGSSNEAHLGLTCANWPGRDNVRPDMSRLGSIPDFLMIQAEFDPATSLANARRVLATYDNAHMVLARGLHGHGILNPSAPACVLSAAAGYLLDGRVPKAKLTSCEPSSAPIPRSLDTPTRLIDAQLKRLFKAS